jgi:hypothetical protein
VSRSGFAAVHGAVATGVATLIATLIATGARVCVAAGVCVSTRISVTARIRSARIAVHAWIFILSTSCADTGKRDEREGQSKLSESIEHKIIS